MNFKKKNIFFQEPLHQKKKLNNKQKKMFTLTTIKRIAPSS